MIDTLAAVITLEEALPERLFERVNISRSVSRTDEEEEEAGSMRFFTPSRIVAGRREPAITYYPHTYAGKRLRVEVSLPKFLGKPLAILGQADVDLALNKLDVFLEARELSIQPIREWKAARIDYVYGWDTGSKTSAYIAALHQVQIGNYDRTPYDYGIVWKAGKGYRWIKFYNKAEEQGLARRLGVLRFELSTYRNAVRYLAQKRYKVAQTVENLTRKELIWKELRHWIKKIGLMEAGFGARQTLERDLADTYGARGAAAASWFLDCYSKYGRMAYQHPYNLITKSTYYVWLRKLKVDGFLAQDARGQQKPREKALPRLAFPLLEDFGGETIGEDWGISGQRNLL